MQNMIDIFLKLFLEFFILVNFSYALGIRRMHRLNGWYVK